MTVPIASLPTTSRYGFLSYWYACSTQVADVNTLTPGIQVCHISAGQLRVTLVDSTSQNVLERLSGATDLPVDGTWHNVMISWDTQALSILANLDGTALSLADSYSRSTGVGFDITYDSTSVYVGGNPNLNYFYTGSLAEFFFLADSVVDITDLTVQQKFIQQVSGIV
jgi:hypothetical protein